MIEPLDRSRKDGLLLQFASRQLLDFTASTNCGP